LARHEGTTRKTLGLAPSAQALKQLRQNVEDFRNRVAECTCADEVIGYQ
jgi:hypothetical protein